MVAIARARRFSTAVAAPSTRSTSDGMLSRISRAMKGPEIEEIAEMKTLRSVQHVTEQLHASPVAASFSAGGKSSVRAWFQSYQAQNGQNSVDREGFQALMKDVSAFIQNTESGVLSDQSKIPAGLDADAADEDLRRTQNAFIEALKLKLARRKCTAAGDSFEHLDADQDGVVSTSDVETLVTMLVEGTNDEWLRYQFQIRDADGDDIINEAESKQVLDSIVVTQKDALAELFEANVDNMPKKHMRLFSDAVDETNWKEKIPEKIRCVFHFAPKEDEENKTVHWESFKESQAVELPELHEMMRVYAKGVYDERYTFYERKQERRSRRIKGVLLALALCAGDFVFAII